MINPFVLLDAGHAFMKAMLVLFSWGLVVRLVPLLMTAVS